MTVRSVGSVMTWAGEDGPDGPGGQAACWHTPASETSDEWRVTSDETGTIRRDRGDEGFARSDPVARPGNSLHRRSTPVAVSFAPPRPFARRHRGSAARLYLRLPDRHLPAPLGAPDAP